MRYPRDGLKGAPIEVFPCIRDFDWPSADIYSALCVRDWTLRLLKHELESRDAVPGSHDCDSVSCDSTTRRHYLYSIVTGDALDDEHVTLSISANMDKKEFMAAGRRQGI